MAQANDSILVTPGSGATVATHLAAGKEHQVVMVADASGHIQQTLPSYTFYIKAVAGAATKDHFDLFNAVGSGKLVELRGLWMTPSLIVGVTGTVCPDFDVIRTSTVGTGGTTVGYKQATFPSISPVDTDNANLPAQITMRVAPAGGATAAEALFTTYVPQEETWAGTNIVQFMNTLPETAMGQRLMIREGQGIKVRQITLGVAQNFSFFGFFTVV